MPQVWIQVVGTRDDPLKLKAHAAVRRAIRMGVLQRGPCSRCGSTINVESHHADYSKPLEVIWLCHSCHGRISAPTNRAVRKMKQFKMGKWKPTDNSTPGAKIALRLWLLEKIPGATVMELYGGGGVMNDQVWSERASAVTINEGDALKRLFEHDTLPQQVFDVDSYASPFEAIELIGQKATSTTVGVVATDGSLRRSAMMRTRISSYLVEKCGFDNASKTQKANIFHNYPSFLLQVLRAILPDWTVEAIAVKYAEGGAWKQATAYFAVVILRKLNSDPDAPSTLKLNT